MTSSGLSPSKSGIGWQAVNTGVEKVQGVLRMVDLFVERRLVLVLVNRSVGLAGNHLQSHRNRRPRPRHRLRSRRNRHPPRRPRLRQLLRQLLHRALYRVQQMWRIAETGKIYSSRGRRWERQQKQHQRVEFAYLMRTTLKRSTNSILSSRNFVFRVSLSPYQKYQRHRPP